MQLIQVHRKRVAVLCAHQILSREGHKKCSLDDDAMLYILNVAELLIYCQPSQAVIVWLPDITDAKMQSKLSYEILNAYQTNNFPCAAKKYLLTLIKKCMNLMLVLFATNRLTYV